MRESFPVNWALFGQGKLKRDSPEKLDCIIDTTPEWLSVIETLKNLEPGGRLVINAIGKEEADKESLLGLGLSHPFMAGKGNQKCCQHMSKRRE